MSIVVEVIAEYLQANRRLVVPAFGAFMVKESGERVFSELLQVDDGVLVSLLSDKGLSEMEVAVTIDRFIFEVRHELEEYGYCRLGDVGTLRVDPETSAIRLCPPVYGEELPTKHSPYIPEPITEETAEETTEETKSEETKSEETKSEEIAEPKKQTTPQPKPKKVKRKRVDWIIILAIITLVAAVSVAIYGWYVSMNNHIDTTADDEAMSSLRIQPKEEIEKE